MKNLDRSGHLRKQAKLVAAGDKDRGVKSRGKWRGRGVVGAFGKAHNRPFGYPGAVTDPRFNHSLRCPADADLQ